MAHSTVVGGSSAHRVIECPASVGLSKNIPPAPSSPYAKEGTALHYVMEQMLFADDPLERAKKFIDTEVDGVMITEDLFIDKIRPAWDATQDAFTRFDVSEYEPEGEVHFKSVEGAFGTCDIFAKGRDDLVVILDYKFGDGVLVSPVENRQLMFYAAAAIEDEKFSDWWTGDLDQVVVLGIIQPAKEHVLATWSTSVRELTAFTAQLIVAVDMAKRKTNVPSVGTWCKWCPAVSVCPAQNRDAKAALGLDPQTAEGLATAMLLADQLEPWIKSVRRLAHEQLERGDRIDGFKLVINRASRKWIDENNIAKKLKGSKKLTADDYLNFKMVSPPQLEKVCKTKGIDFGQFAEYYDMVSTGTTVVPEADSREGIVKTADRSIPEALDKLLNQ